jgi:hypothetical protein
MREPPRWFEGLAVLSAAMIKAVLDKSYQQHQASARRYAGETLQDRIVDGAKFAPENSPRAARGEKRGARALPRILQHAPALMKPSISFCRGRSRRAEN